MKFIVSLLLCALSVSGTDAMSHRPPDATITLGGSINYPYVSHNGGTVYLQVHVNTEDRRPNRRRPMNIAVVLDRSGSMADEGKMEYAREALRALINHLTADDYFSLVVYDHSIDVMRPAARVGNKRDLLRMVDRIQPRGRTNLGGGMVEGFRQVKQHAGRELVNRVILLSDGLANEGITDPAELNSIARDHRRRGISITTMGVGLAYNENLMMGLSESGGGNYYFIEGPYAMAEIMQKEFSTISAVLVQNAVLELRPGRGVTVRDVVGCEHRRRGDLYTIALGDLYSNEMRELIVELAVPEGSGSIVVATGSLRFDVGDIRINRVQPFEVRVRYSRDLAEVERNRNMDVQARADVAVSTRKVEDALKALDEGRDTDANNLMEEARRSLAASPAATAAGNAAAVVRMQEAKIQDYRDSLLLQDRDRAKKSIQYDNYRTQKNR